MSIYYFDTSAVIKNYHPEHGTEAIRQLVGEPDSYRVLSRLTITEVQRAFTRRARQKMITADELKRLRGILYKDLQERRFRIARVQEFHHHTAVRVLLKYWPQDRTPLLRTADAIHLAVALRLRDSTGLDYFVCADADLCEVAEAEQLSVINPELS
jgi:predicted nucleic acid-binding protein